MLKKELKNKYLLDADVFIAYIKEDKLSSGAEKVVNRIREDEIKPFTSSILYDDIISGLRSKGAGIKKVRKVMVTIAAIPHEPLSITPEISINALDLYDRHGGSRKLHYFDSFHVATARLEEIPMITSDKYILENRKDLGIDVLDLSEL